MRDQIAFVAKSAGADIFDPRKSLCNERNCITQLNGVSIYKDDVHIAASQIGIVEDNLKHVLRFTAAAERVSAVGLRGASVTSDLLGQN